METIKGLFSVMTIRFSFLFLLVDQLKAACGYDYKNENLDKVKDILFRYPSLLNEKLDSAGCTALIISSRNNFPNVVSFLLSLPNIDVNKKEKIVS
jgi:hypothetical protein